ncbi:867_t:CDS:2, partial [Entrophospora sp. SA101]
TIVTQSRLLDRAGATAIGTAAAKANVLTDYEDQEIQKLVNEVIENQLKKLELKLQQFEELESVIENEKKELEKQRQLFYLELLLSTAEYQQKQQQLQQPPIGPLIKEE